MKSLEELGIWCRWLSRGIAYVKNNYNRNS